MVGKQEKPSGVTEAALSQATSTAETSPYMAQRTGHTETCRGAGRTGFQCHAFCRDRKLVTPAVGEGHRQTRRPVLQNTYASLPWIKSVTRTKTMPVTDSTLQEKYPLLLSVWTGDR